MKIILLLLFTLSSTTWGQTMDNMSNRQKFKHIFENLNKDTMHLVDEFYHPDIEFHDPIGSLKGVKKMRRYYERMYKSVTSIKFEFSNFVESGDDVVGVWKMTLVTPNLKGGEPVVVDGNSVVKFKNGKAIYHRDYFDMGVFIYENIPVLGFMVKKIKNRFKAEEE
jgi:ketosteroid isomerase-like protein